MNIYNRKDLHKMMHEEEIDAADEGFMVGFLNAYKEK